MKFSTTFLLVCVCGLLALGMVMLYSSRMGQAGESLLLTQLKWCGLGLTACLIAASLDYRFLKRGWISILLLGLAVILLGLVFVPGVGVKVNGAWRWIGLGKFRFQPSELAKLAVVIALAHYGDRFSSKMPRLFRGLIIPGLIACPALVLIFLEPDWGTMILLAAVSLGVLLLAGARWWHVVPPVLIAGAGLAFLLMHNPTRLERVKAWWNPEAYKDGPAYQTWQSILAFGSGGWDGRGLGNSRQKLGFLPEHTTDFVFPVIGEELGVVTTLAVLTTFGLLVMCGVGIAWRASDSFGFLLAGGLTLMIGLQALINIGVVTGALPNKGLPLPFLSYGGSNLVMSLTAIGLLVSIGGRTGEPAADETGALGDPETALATF